MRTKHLSFQLEETIPGTFLAQGWLGGILTGFVYTVVTCLSMPRAEIIEVAKVFTGFLVLGTIIGVLKSVIMWMPYRVFKIQVRAVTRVTMASTVTVLLALSLALLDGHFKRDDYINWLLTWLMGGLPTAILIGSSIKPWDLFTFGSIAGRRRRSVLRTFGTLPLRFLSLLTLAAATFGFACQVQREIPPLKLTLRFSSFALYLLFSAYLTFRSPRKEILWIAGLVANISVVLVGYFVFGIRADEVPFYIGVLGASLVVAWAFFLVARLTVPIGNEAFLNTLSNISQSQIDQRDHHCLGSRFVEWEQPVA